MPIDKTTGEKICINGCGPLQSNVPDDTPDFSSYYIPSLDNSKDGKQRIVRIELGYSLDIWTCKECGYIELYDDELGRN